MSIQSMEGLYSDASLATATLCNKYAITDKTLDVNALYIANLSAPADEEIEANDMVNFPIVTLEDLCPQALSSEACSPFKERVLAHVGTWVSDDGRWQAILVIAGLDHNPFRAFKGAEAVMLLAGNMPSLPGRRMQFEADLNVSIEEPETVWTVKGFKPETKLLGQMKKERFDESTSVKHFYIWRRVIELWATRFNHDRCVLHVDISTDTVITRRPDLSHIGTRLKHSYELLGMIAEVLDLRDVQS